MIELDIACARSVLSGLANRPREEWIAVNVSPKSLLSPMFMALLDEFPKSRIVLEITEHAAVDDYDELMRRVAAIREQGARIAVDDTGAGYASLRHVLRLKPDFIKLDISLTRNIDTTSELRNLVRALMTFARSTGAVIVAEGVENDAELRTLRGLGVPLAQGYLLGRPAALPVD